MLQVQGCVAGTLSKCLLNASDLLSLETPAGKYSTVIFNIDMISGIITPGTTQYRSASTRALPFADFGVNGDSRLCKQLVRSVWGSMTLPMNTKANFLWGKYSFL